MTNTKTTTSRALTTEERTNERRTQARETFADYIRANHNQSAEFNRIYQELLYQDAEKAVYIALRARHEKSGLQFLADLQNDQATDRTARNNLDIVADLDRLEQLHQSHRKGADFFTARAQSLTLTDIERATALALADDLINKANAERGQIDDLHTALQITYTDRADLTQTAILTMLEHETNPAPITARILAEYGATTEDELTAEERAQAQAVANWRAVVNAVGRTINTLTHPDANNRHTTKAEPITLDEVADYITRYGAEVLNGLQIPHTTKRTSASQCYITIEERNTKTQKGFYKVTHYKTVAPYIYIEDYAPTDDNGESDAQYIKVSNPIIDSYGALEGVTDLCERANLTQTERVILEYYARATRYYDNKADIVNYVATACKISRATVYRKLESIKTALTPIAKDLHIITR